MFFRYVWIVVLLIYLLGLIAYSYIVFKAALSDNTEPYTEEDKIIAGPSFKKKVDLISTFEDFAMYHEGLIVVWVITMIFLGGSSLIVYFVTRG